MTRPADGSRRTTPADGDRRMIPAGLLDVVQCPDCGGTLAPEGDGARCGGCGRAFSAERGYLDLRPSATFDEQTKYLDEALHVDARHESISPPLLGSRIRNDMLRTFLRLGPGDRVIDLGCGSGRALAWNTDTGATLTGIDISPFFAHDAIGRFGLLLGDLRRLPLRDGAFTKAWTLDVLEHLSPQALRDVLGEANRVLADDGALFIYTHVRRNGWISGGLRLVNRLAHALERRGLLDLSQERLRKSDHLNPIADHEELARVLDECGFRIERLTYYTPIIGALVENVLVRVVEKTLTRRAARRLSAASASDPAAVREVRTSAKARIGRKGITYGALLVLSAVMKLDVWLFGRLRSGPFFALVRRKGTSRHV
ncbi:MAG: methyltransferase domain-containing protein [Vicinamibacterales bacterium]